MLDEIAALIEPCLWNCSMSVDDDGRDPGKVGNAAARPGTASRTAPTSPTEAACSSRNLDST